MARLPQSGPNEHEARDEDRSATREDTCTCKQARLLFLKVINNAASAADHALFKDHALTCDECYHAVEDYVAAGHAIAQARPLIEALRRAGSAGTEIY